jgi:hypothetical protein
MVLTMNEDSDLRELEQRTFRAANQDGLTEMMMGLMVIVIGGIMINSFFVAFVALIIIFQAVAIEQFREKYTYPRIGRVKFTEEQMTDYGPYWGVFAFMMIIALASVIVSVFIQNEIIEIVARWAPLIMSIGLLHQFTLLGQKSGLKGYYGVGVFITILGAILVLLEFPAALARMEVYLLVVGGVLFLTGLVILMRFIRKYPVLDLEEMGYEQEE